MGYRVCEYSLQNNAKLFSKVVVLFYISTSMHKSSGYLQTLQSSELSKKNFFSGLVQINHLGVNFHFPDY